MSAIEIAKVGLAEIQDGGRPHRMHEGVPPGGALVPELLARANAAADNASDVAAIEAHGQLAIVARGRVRVGIDDGSARHLEAGERWDVPARAGAIVRYVAVRGGFDVPVVLGGRGTLRVAGLGGFEGRALRRGDVLRVASEPLVANVAPESFDTTRRVRVVLGPDPRRFAAGAIETLLTAPYRISATRDRAGIPLVGPPLDRADADLARSMPMAKGALQVPGSGTPIVLGPDHPTTGGYPVIATIIRADFGSLAARVANAEVRFEAVTADQARVIDLAQGRPSGA